MGERDLGNFRPLYPLVPVTAAALDVLLELLRGSPVAALTGFGLGLVVLSVALVDRAPAMPLSG